MKQLILLAGMFLTASFQSPYLVIPKTAPSSSLNSLSNEQQNALTTFIHERERPNDDKCRVVAARDEIAVRSSTLLHDLFPRYQFVKIPWVFSIGPHGRYLCSIPYGIFDVLTLDDDANTRFAFHSTGNDEEYGEFLHAEGIKVTTDANAGEIAMAKSEIYGYQGECCANIRRKGSEWWLFYSETPFRMISSYEEVREAAYYRIRTDSSGVVIDGRWTREELERRKIK